MSDTTALTVRPDGTAIQTIDEWRALLDTLNDLTAIKDLHDIAEIHRRYARTVEAQRVAGEAKLWAARRGGQVLHDDPGLGRGGDRKSTDSVSLDSYGIAPHTSSRWQRLYNLGADRIYRYCKDTDEPTYNGCIHWSEKAAVVTSETNEWYTPAVYVDRARDVLGSIDLDPASNDEANAVIKAKTFYTIREDGLDQDWTGRVWMNPPYGRIAAAFVEKLVDHYENGSVTAAITLVNAHTTDTAWFQPLWDYTLCFTDHRIDFAAGTATRKGSTHGSVFVYLGPDPAVFAALFKDFGTVVVRYS